MCEHKPTWCEQCAHSEVCAIRFNYDEYDERALGYCADFLCKYAPLCLTGAGDGPIWASLSRRDDCCAVCQFEEVEE